MNTYELVNYLRNAVEEYERAYLVLEIAKIIYKVVYNRGKQ